MFDDTRATATAILHAFSYSKKHFPTPNGKLTHFGDLESHWKIVAVGVVYNLWDFMPIQWSGVGCPLGSGLYDLAHSNQR